MPQFSIPFWRRLPAVKLFIPLFSGILIQQNWGFPYAVSVCFLWIGAILLVVPFFVSKVKRYFYLFFSGIGIMFLFLAAGMFLAFSKSIKNDRTWFGHFELTDKCVQVTLLENIIEKENSWKALAKVNTIYSSNTQAINVSGRLLLYFSKKHKKPLVKYGTKLIINSSVLPIKNIGNPGGFDYNRYCLFQGITHQAILQQNQYIAFNEPSKNFFQEFLINARERVLWLLEKYIPGKEEKGLAEALLIGYKNNLERPLVMSYTNTGIAHVIAISGMHLGLIYWLLTKVLARFLKRRKTKWIAVLSIIIGLWLFTLIAGAQVSLVRAAVMFTCIVLGSLFERSGYIFNTLFFSAIILLCINPFWIWDVGFQLSYAALLSILIFLKPIYHVFYFKNKMVSFFWELTAISLAAQVLTLPISIYHFHQFPTYFILSNFVAVPISGLVLLLEVGLCCLFFLHPVVFVLGKVISWFLMVMNKSIRFIESFQFSLIDELQISILDTILLYVFIAALSFWLMQKKPGYKWVAIVVFSLIAGSKILNNFSLISQKKCIIYNVPKHSAIDFIAGREYQFLGDSALVPDDFLRNFYIKPSRIMFQVQAGNLGSAFSHSGYEFLFYSKRIILAQHNLILKPNVHKPVIDVLIYTKNVPSQLKAMMQIFSIKQIVSDGSYSSFLQKKLASDCLQYHIPYFSTPLQGAFVLNLN